MGGGHTLPAPPTQSAHRVKGSGSNVPNLFSFLFSSIDSIRSKMPLTLLKIFSLKNPKGKAHRVFQEHLPKFWGSSWEKRAAVAQSGDLEIPCKGEGDGLA